MTIKQRPPFLADSLPNGCVRQACGITLDISRQRLCAQQLDGLFALAQEKRLLEADQAMQRGDIVNTSEQRAALHTALRDPSVGAPYHTQVQQALERMYAFAGAVRSGQWLGARGDAITDVVNIGIGGSEMGPQTVYHALRAPNPSIRLHFLAAADGVLFDRVLAGLNPFRTLVVVSSKSFKTRETAVNATAVDQWLLEAGIVGADRGRHLVVVSGCADAAREMNLPQDNLFPIWDWVGGRFSVWSAIGLPVVVALGEDVFRRFLDGAHAMDQHAATAPLPHNLPALLALLSYWNARSAGTVSHCFLPYDERLRGCVGWLQQLEMESLGKTETPSGQHIDEPTGVGVWGGHGNESQHSFYQWLREGTGRTSIDLCWCEKPGHKHAELHRVLVANARAQVMALVTRPDESQFFNAVTALSIDQLSADRLGALMALYEHKTTMLGTLFDINPFDQPGVEFGKRLSLGTEKNVKL